MRFAYEGRLGRASSHLAGGGAAQVAAYRRAGSLPPLLQTPGGAAAQHFPSPLVAHVCSLFFFFSFSLVLPRYTS